MCLITFSPVGVKTLIDGGSLLYLSAVRLYIQLAKYVKEKAGINVTHTPQFCAVQSTGCASCYDFLKADQCVSEPNFFLINLSNKNLPQV